MSRSVHRGAVIFGAFLLLVVLAALPGPTVAYETYHDPNTQDTGYCATCHTGFPGRGDTHDMHVGNSQFTPNCNLCHTGSGRDNPVIAWSTGDGSAGSTLGCMGCHGRDYGETISSDIDNGTAVFATTGLPKASGYGLRKQHLLKGVTGCLDCHADVPRCDVKPESEMPPYYPRNDVNPWTPCHPGAEDGTPELNGEDALGLDNDGDGRHDFDDPDCGVVTGTPNESGFPCGGNDLRITGVSQATGALTFDWGSNCSTTGNAIYYGSLTQADLAGYNYTRQSCNVGAGGPFSFNPGAGSFFFLVVGDDTVEEGSYGQGLVPDPNGSLFFVERPPAGTTCFALPQNLADRCD